MSNFFLLFSDKPINSNKLKLEKVSVDERIRKFIERRVSYCYRIEPIADVEKTAENEKAPEFYEATNLFFKNLYEICSENLYDGAFLALVMTYFNQSFKEIYFEMREFSVGEFLNRYLSFEFDTIYKIISG